MSLKVWLPLNGNLENKGTDIITITNNGAITDSAGKTGMCYSFNGSTSYISLSGSKLFQIFTGGTQQFSITMWVYHADATRGILFGDYSTSGAINFNIELSTSHGIRFYWAGSPDTSPSNATVAASEWTHVALTYNGTKIQSYINGVAKGSWSGTLGTKNKTSGEFRLGRDSRSDSTAFNGKLNDVRIYDHCLSAAEVKEISQGLVLHYKLNDEYCIPTTNLLGTNSEKFTGIWRSYGFGSHGEITTANIPPALSGEVGLVTNKDNGTYSAEIATSVGNTVMNKGDTLTFSAYVKGNGNTVGKTGNIHLYNTNGTNTISTGSSFIFTNEWQRVKYTLTWTYDNPSNASANCYVYCARAQGESFYISNCQLERGNIMTGFTNGIRDTNIIYDNSGYNNNGSTLNTISLSDDTVRYNYSTNLVNGNSMINCGRGGMVTDSITVNIWCKYSSWSNPVSCTEGGGWNMESNGGSITFPVYISSVGYVHSKNGTNAEQLPPADYANAWHMFTGTYNKVDKTVSLYVDGILKQQNVASSGNNIAYHSSNCIWIGAEATSSNTTASNGMAGLFSDFRIYATALSADDIKSLYQMGAAVDNKGCLHSYELKEWQENIIHNAEVSRTLLQFTDGLSKYTQANCQVTLTADGYHIYRPPNLTVANDGNTMWGGLKLVNQSSDTIAAYNATRDNIWNLQQNHTYIWSFHVKGQTSNAVNPSIQSNMGWDRIAGIGPNPTTLAVDGLPQDFNGEKDCLIIFTITDAIVKTATENKSNYVQGTDYLSYRDLALNFTYTSTGTLGTDIYITNLRLYDITSHMAEFTKRGQSNFYDFVEQMDKCEIRKNSELLSTNFIEF